MLKATITVEGPNVYSLDNALAIVRDRIVDGVTEANQSNPGIGSYAFKVEDDRA